LACCSSLLLLSAAQARPEEHIELPDWSKTPVEDRDLGHGVHMLESFGGNIGVVAGENAVLLIDAEWPQLHDKVVAAVRRISPQPIRYVVNTHWHFDHAGGDELFVRSGAVLIASEQTRRYLLDDRQTAPVITVKHNMTFHLGGQTVNVIHVRPAHTDGDLVIQYVEADIIQTGDTFFHGFYPDIDQPHGGTIDGMIAWYDELYALCGPDTRIIPGHGPVANRQDVKEYQGMLREVRNRVAKAVRAGLTEEQLTASHPLDDLDVKWGGNLIKQPYLLAIVYEELKTAGSNKAFPTPSTAR